MFATKNFRENLRLAMKSEGITQREMAKRVRVSYPFVNRILKGKTTPDLDLCDKLAERVGFSLDVLLLPPREFSRRCSRRMLVG